MIPPRPLSSLIDDVQQHRAYCEIERHALHLSWAEVARQLDVHPKTLQRWARLETELSKPLRLAVCTVLWAKKGAFW